MKRVPPDNHSDTSRDSQPPRYGYERDSFSSGYQNQHHHHRDRFAEMKQDDKWQLSSPLQRPDEQDNRRSGYVHCKGETAPPLTDNMIKWEAPPGTCVLNVNCITKLLMENTFFYDSITLWGVIWVKIGEFSSCRRRFLVGAFFKELLLYPYATADFLKYCIFSQFY